jgi:hypothetical protein
MELHALWDAAWMNEVITKHKELTALVSLLADGLMGKPWLQLVLLAPSVGAFPILLFFRRVGCCAQAVIPGCGRGLGDSPATGRDSPGSYPGRHGASGGDWC